MGLINDHDLDRHHFSVVVDSGFTASSRCHVSLRSVCSQLEITEGTPDLGVTSYWTDAEGNVVFGPNTPKEKMKTSGTKMQKRKESVSKPPPVEKQEEESKSKEVKEETKLENVANIAAEEPKASEDAKEDLVDEPLTADQPEEQPAEEEAEAQHEVTE
ncbi:smoothelin-like protein 1 [Stegastes partitus]|uniref:Smoothelin-like protein 1 n=1 Tax=Stegastes partitus TaxID=144197 RepID=A0A9Y4NK91_9TELE|nr:PREDICTED: smoothelin-like protein 1 [Stegastes partitus]